MPSSLAYTRKFIILKKEFSTMAERSPKGHCKLEIKGLRGIVTVNIENAEKDNFYNVLFISNDSSNLTWELGKIFTDEIGRGKGEYTFIQRELESKNFPIDKISGILIMRDKEIFLGGYLEKEDGAIERYIESIPEPMVQSISEPREEVVEPAYNPAYDIPATEPIMEEEDIKVTEYESSEDIPVEEIVEVNNEEAIEEVIEEFIEEVIEEEAVQEEITHEVEFDYEDSDEDSMEPDYKTLDYIRKINQKNQTTNYVLSILRFFPYIDPFKYNLKGYNWWLVELDKENEYRAFLPYFSYIVGGNNKEPYSNNIPTCNQLMSKYQHYLFGLYNEGETVKYFVYGIPGEFSVAEHPYRGANGFNTWYQGRHVEGYWVIYIDPMNGKPVNPVIPMIPID